MEEDPGMFRSVSTRGGPSKYERLEKESADKGTFINEELKRTASVPTRESSSSNYGGINLQRNLTKKANNNKEKSHPIFSFFDLRRKKKTPTARPEITRYMEYVKEGGMWDSDANKPVIHYK